jgi:AcrR family transcriptional regulator
MTEDSQPGEPPEGRRGQARRGGRRQGASTTRDDILKAARKLFADQGFKGTTTRAIAREARVDAALVHYFFSTKEGLFAEAVQDALDPSVVLEAVRAQPRGTTGERLVCAFLGLWDDPEAREPMLAVVRSSLAHDEGARLVNDMVTTQVIGEVLAAHGGIEQSDTRIALIGTQIVGILMVRYLFEVEPLAHMEPEQIAASLGPGIDRLITADLNEISGH